MVSKVTVKSAKYTNILMGTVQAAIANGVLDAVRAGDIPKDKVNDLGIIYSVWLDPSVTEVDDLDHKALFDVHREATATVIKKAMRIEPTIDWLLENQDKITHYLQFELKSPETPDEIRSRLKVAIRGSRSSTGVKAMAAWQSRPPRLSRRQPGRAA
jgi:hypothetical protein